MNLRLALWRTHERGQVIIYRLVGRIGAKSVSLSAKPFRRTRESLIGDPGNKPFVHERSGASHLDHRQERGRRTVRLHIAVCQEQSTDALRMPNYEELRHRDRKSTRLNSSHLGISYAVFCLKK